MVGPRKTCSSYLREIPKVNYIKEKKRLSVFPNHFDMSLLFEIHVLMFEKRKFNCLQVREGSTRPCNMSFLERTKGQLFCFQNKGISNEYLVHLLISNC